MSCIFCKMVNKEIEHHIVAEDEKFLAFLSLYPNTRGATVVIPKQHFSSYAFDLDDSVLYDLITFTNKLQRNSTITLKMLAEQQWYLKASV
ncbi:HIT family protein [Acinetobacter nectaris]|uniref:HIT family protein n=1 Tax=Acinetobacter nectaris TaxID=1219382 RepID=UPI001F38E120|nr:HIT family protein [Acinetobacter nectaris]